jgi:hypothetical protein
VVATENFELRFTLSEPPARIDVNARVETVAHRASCEIGRRQNGQHFAATADQQATALDRPLAARMRDNRATHRHGHAE